MFLIVFFVLIVPVASATPVEYEHSQSTVGIHINDADSNIQHVTNINYLDGEESRVTTLAYSHSTVIAPTDQKQELAIEDLRDEEAEQYFDPREAKIVVLVVTVGGSVIGLLIVICLAGRHLYRRYQRKQRQGIRREEKVKVLEAMTEEGILNASKDIPLQMSHQEPLSTTSPKKHVRFNIPPSPSLSRSSSISSDSYVSASSDWPLSADGLPSLAKVSLVPLVGTGKPSQSTADIPLVAIPIDPAKAVTSVVLNYGHPIGASSFTILISSES